MLVQEKRSIYLAIELSLREISYVLYAHALMTRKSCAVGMRNAIPRNHFNVREGITSVSKEILGSDASSLRDVDKLS